MCPGKAGFPSLYLIYICKSEGMLLRLKYLRDLQFVSIKSNFQIRPIKVKFNFGLFSFGFGVLNADEIVSAAEDWENVPPGDSCEIHPGAENTNLQGGPGDVIILRFNASNCSINYAEHVQVQK